MKNSYKLSNNLATILARDKVVVVVRLKIFDGCKAYVSKNSDEEVEYCILTKSRDT
jgi:hypothetical protein